MNLFEIFDPATSTLPFNWFSLSFGLMVLPCSYFLAKGRLPSIFNRANMELTTFTSLSSPNAKWSIVVASLIFFIIMMNTNGLLPWVFTPSSHPSITLTLGLSLWTGWLLMNLYNYIGETFATLTPNGISYGLALFLAIVETISLMIRPLTLSIRLAANMIAGHLILNLVSSFLVSMVWYLCLPLSILTGLILILEIAVALIQSYVFMALLVLYIS